MYDVYLAGPFFNEYERKLVDKAKQILVERGLSVFSPKEHFIPNGWNMSNVDWGQAVFEMDKKAIPNCKYIVALYHGLYSDSGTAWEIGYAYALEKQVLIVCVNNDMSSVMISNGSTAVIDNIEELKDFDFYQFPTIQSIREQK